MRDAVPDEVRVTLGVWLGVTVCEAVTEAVRVRLGDWLGDTDDDGDCEGVPVRVISVVIVCDGVLVGLAVMEGDCVPD